MTTVETIYRLLSDFEYVEIYNTITLQTEYYGVAMNIPLDLLDCEVLQLIGGIHKHEKYSQLWNTHIILYIVKE